MHNLWRVLGLLAVLIGVAACSGEPAPEASADYVLGERLLRESFDEPDSWESFGLDVIQFTPHEGKYRVMSPGGGYIWALNDDEHGDVVIEVEMEILTPTESGVYGIICRAHPSNNGMGYYFLLDALGRFGIRRGDGTRVHVMVPWTEHSAIRDGANTIRLLCIEDYLALYINGEFAAETRDDWFERGLTGITANANEGLPAAADFDNLTIWEASLAN